MKKKTTKRVISFVLVILSALVISEFLFPLPSVFPAEIFPTIKEREIVQMLDKKIFQIFEKHPERFLGNPADGFDDDEGGNQSEIYFLIEDRVFLPGTYVKLLDGSVAYWVASGDTFSEIYSGVRKIRGQSDQVSRAKIEAEAKKQGLESPDKIAINDILVFKWREAK